MLPRQAAFVSAELLSLSRLSLRNPLGTNSPMQSRLDAVADWFDAALKSNFESFRLALLCHVTVRQLQRYFAWSATIPPQHWLDLVRLKIARDRLLANEPTKVVAYELGYRHVPQFCRAYKRTFGCRPGATTPATRALRDGDHARMTCPLLGVRCGLRGCSRLCAASHR